jgi:hypothetical protein
MSFIRLRHDCTMESLIIHAAIESKKLPAPSFILERQPDTIVQLKVFFKI